MKNVIIDLVDTSNQYIIEELCRRKTYNIVGVISHMYDFVQTAPMASNISVYPDCNHVPCSIDLCIVLNNINFQKSAAINYIKEYLSKNIPVDCYYWLSKEDCDQLERYAKELDVVFSIKNPNYGYKSSNNYEEQKELDIPVVYISGLHEHCDILSSHLKLESICVSNGYKCLNITNSPYAELFDYLPLYSLYNPCCINAFTTIPQIKKLICNAVEKTQSNLLIVSNIYNFVPFQGFFDDFGVDNYLLSNALDFDYLLYNIPSNMFGSQKVATLERMVSVLTGVDKVSLGVSHVIVDKYFDGNYYFIPMLSSEYVPYVAKCKYQKANFVDPLSDSDINSLFQE